MVDTRVGHPEAHLEFPVAVVLALALQPLHGTWKG